jgi:translation initiation factor IF-1
MSRSVDGFMPDERLALTLDNGMKVTARVSETFYDSRTPEATRIQITGTSPLA